MQNIEFAQIEVQVVEGLKQGNQALEALHKVETTVIYRGTMVALIECGDTQLQFLCTVPISLLIKPFILLVRVFK